jgi:glycosyltransferase involved in cell wall biosynthesis
MRIIEIGGRPYFKSVFPDETIHFSTSHTAGKHDPAGGHYALSLRTLPVLHRTLREPADLIVCQATFFSPWHWQCLVRALFDRRALRGNIPLLRAWGPQLLRFPLRAPLAVLDLQDSPIIHRSNFFLLDRCRFYFKRELPTDHWRLLITSGHASLPTPRLRRNARYIELLKKVRPISLGLPRGVVDQLPTPTQDKTADIFFAGRVQGSTIRERGMKEILALREQGVRVDIPDQPLSRSEFYARYARSWLVWSPEGYGWQCFRHYEAPGCGSVPVINQPTIERSRPLRHGEHAIFYDVEAGGLTRAIVTALADKAWLADMARAGRAHVLACHTPRAIAEDVIATVLGNLK